VSSLIAEAEEVKTIRKSKLQNEEILFILGGFIY
jgi:hypothetical protein